MHKDVEAMIVAPHLNAIRDTEVPWMNDAVFVHVRHEYPAATFSDIITYLDRVVLGSMVLLNVIICAIRYVVGLCSSNLNYLLLS